MTSEYLTMKPEIKLSWGWVTFPFVYKGQQIIAQVSPWTPRTRIWLNDELVDQIDSWKFSETHEVTLPDGEVLQIKLGYRWGTTLYCEAYSGSEQLFSKDMIGDATGRLVLLGLLVSGVVVGGLTYALGKLIGGLLAQLTGAA